MARVPQTISRLWQCAEMSFELARCTQVGVIEVLTMAATQMASPTEFVDLDVEAALSLLGFTPLHFHLTPFDPTSSHTLLLPHLCSNVCFRVFCRPAVEVPAGFLGSCGMSSGRLPQTRNSEVTYDPNLKTTIKLTSHPLQHPK